MALIGGSSSSSASLSIQREQNLSQADYSEGDGPRSNVTIGSAKNIGQLTTTDFGAVDRGLEVVEGLGAASYQLVDNTQGNAFGLAQLGLRESIDFITSASAGTLDYQNKALHQVATASESEAAKQSNTLLLAVMGIIATVGVVQLARARGK